ncbi:MAG: hypothetical protein DHS20C09_08760 [marine bacterium B5-7]|nr:MAG: hypothetical protein DHS20C09_08760 [marine bacterium B5-7]
MYSKLDIYSLFLNLYDLDSEPLDTVYLDQMSIAVVYFEILLSTKVYEDYCTAKRDKDEIAQNSIKKEYPNIEAMWIFWGDIFSFERWLDQEYYFAAWFLKGKNFNKFYPLVFHSVAVVFEGEEVVAEPNTVIVPIPRTHDIRVVSRILGRKLQNIVDLLEGKPGEFVVELKKQLEYSDFGSKKFEQTTDAMYWRNYLGMTPFQCILTAHRCNKPAWEDIKYKIDRCFKTSHKADFNDLSLDDVKSVVRIFDRLKNEGEAISNSLLNDKFTAPSINPF